MKPFSSFPADAPMSPWRPNMLSMIVFLGIVFGLIATILFLSRWLGEKKENPEKSRPYESGIIPTGSARVPYPVPYFLVAIFFLIFDVEGAYIFSWAIAFEELGWGGWLQVSFFIFILFVSLMYLWKKGGLEWGPKAQNK